ncbi:MAG: hypothetical protein QNJ38_03740 [Prochloraceae cyanobacterium]|nr:hypothetical protein [Prochloraceae cyanobacterium]
MSKNILFLSCIVTALSISGCQSDAIESKQTNSSKKQVVLAKDKLNICQDAVASVEKQLNKIDRVKVESSEILNQNYPYHPKGRPNNYKLVISGDEANAVMNNDILLNSLATQIINNCDSISLVRFNLYFTGYILEYGLMPDGTVKKFQCPAGFKIGEPYPRPLEWGEQCSP